MDQPALEIRQEAFRQLVERQDNGTSVVQSRDEIKSQFSLSAEQLQGLAELGIDFWYDFYS